MWGGRWMLGTIWAVFILLGGFALYAVTLSVSTEEDLGSLQVLATNLEAKTVLLTDQSNRLATDLAQARSELAIGFEELRGEIGDAASSFRSELEETSSRLGAEISQATDGVASLRTQVDGQDAQLEAVLKTALPLGRGSDALRADIASLSSQVDAIELVDFNSVYRQKWPSVFRIDTPIGTGSGWLLEPGLLVTAQHVIEGYNSVLVRQGGGAPFTAIVVAYDSLYDIALLRFDTGSAPLQPSVSPLTLGSISTGEIATPLMALGYSGGGGVKEDGSVGSANANIGVLSQVINFGDF